MAPTIDLNSDLGEGYGPYRIADDEKMLSIVSSANIACGGHAGDPVVMDQTVRAALHNKVLLGAHIGFPDREGFGRRMMILSMKELELLTITQLGTLSAIAHHAGGRLTHANFHGALGNLSFVDRDVAKTVIGAVKAFDSTLSFIGLPHTQAYKEAERQGMNVISSFLADRAYSKEGVIISRQRKGAMIHDHQKVYERVKQVLTTGTVETIDGQMIEMPVDSILIHSDTLGALKLAQSIVRAAKDSNTKIMGYIKPQ